LAYLILPPRVKQLGVKQMINKKFGIETLILAIMLVGMALVPAASA
jgi:hypothetical protein